MPLHSHIWQLVIYIYINVFNFAIASCPATAQADVLDFLEVGILRVVLERGEPFLMESLGMGRTRTNLQRYTHTDKSTKHREAD